MESHSSFQSFPSGLATANPSSVDPAFHSKQTADSQAVSSGPESASSTATASVSTSTTAHPSSSAAPSSSNVFSQVPSMQSHRFPADNPFIPELTNISIPLAAKADGLDAHAMESDKTADANTVVIPSYTAWFSMASVHDIEKRDFAEFFGPAATKSSSDYVECRDFMINAYRKDPTEYISVTSCRRHLSLDVASIIKIHSFLEQWGLINSQISIGERPAIVTPVDTRHFKVFAQGPKGLVTLVSPAAGTAPGGVTTAVSESQVVPNSTSSTLTAAAESSTDNSVDLNLYPNVMKLDEKATNSISPLPRYNCHTCGVVCDDDYYHCLKMPMMHLCKFCFIEGRFSSAYYSGDFVHMKAETKAGPTVNAWSDQESLYLLEGIEMFGDNWEQVSRHVGTRTREECIAHFLEFPIQDKYLNASTAPPVPHFNIPFSAGDNPILGIVAWLASMVHPNVAAAAAQSGLREYEKLLAEEQRKDQAMEAESGAPSGDAHPDIHSTAASPTPLPALDAHALEKISHVVLSSATEQAASVVKNEEQKIQKYVSMLIEAQLKKMELKMQQFEALEIAIEAERLEMEKQKQSLYEERMALRKTMIELQAKEKARQDQELNEAISSVMNPSMLDPQGDSLTDVMEGVTYTTDSPLGSVSTGSNADTQDDVKYITEL